MKKYLYWFLISLATWGPGCVELSHARAWKADELAKIVKQYPRAADEADFENWLEEAHKASLAGECSINTSRPCERGDSYAKKFKALGYRAKNAKWFDQATICDMGETHLSGCDEYRRMWRIGCEISWCTKAPAPGAEKESVK